jgi:hypothetical protein
MGAKFANGWEDTDATFVVYDTEADGVASFRVDVKTKAVVAL